MVSTGGLGAELYALIFVGIILVIGITIIQPQLNNLTTGLSPVIPATGAGGVLISYTGIFLLLAYFGAIFAVAYRQFSAGKGK